MCVYGALDQLEVLQSQGPPLDQPLSDPVDSIPENHRSFLEGLEAHTEPLAGVEEGWKPQLGPQGRGAEHEQQPGASVSGRPATFSASASSEGVAGSGQGGLPPQVLTPLVCDAHMEGAAARIPFCVPATRRQGRPAVAALLCTLHWLP